MDAKGGSDQPAMSPSHSKTQKSNANPSDHAMNPALAMRSQILEKDGP
jgi:hypothetical protein